MTSTRGGWLPIPMPPAPMAVLAVAATYVTFLIHAQFGFLHQLQTDHPAAATVRLVMGAMGLCGLAVSLLTAVWLARVTARRLVAFGFAASGLAAAAAPFAHAVAAYVVVGAATGAGLAVLTTALATGLDDLAGRDRQGRRRVGRVAGLGTGLAYLLCNVPVVFEAAPADRAAVAAVACAGGLVAVLLGAPGRPWGGADDAVVASRWVSRLGFAATLAVLAALVFLDSAAFAWIQQTPLLKAATWATPAQKWGQGITHLLAAVGAGWWFDRGHLRGLLWGTWAAFLLALAPLGGGDVPWGVLYAAGIAVYSVVLVAYPAGRGDGGNFVAVPMRWRAALLFGLAGWVASAAGVGMAQDLGRVPMPVLWLGGVLLAMGGVAAGLAARPWDGSGGPRWLSLWRSLALTAGLALLGGLVVVRSAPAPRSAAAAPAGPSVLQPPDLTARLRLAGFDPEAVARGRAVYVAEGCIHCHSQYVRPPSVAAHGAAWWGPARPLDRRQVPVLIGNRRQGPDLANVGLRRSSIWQRLHLEDPRRLVPGSRMPSYRHLFAPADAGGAARSRPSAVASSPEVPSGEVTLVDDAGAVAASPELAAAPPPAAPAPSRGDDLVAYLGSLGLADEVDLAALRAEQIARWPVPVVTSLPPAAGARLFARYCAVCHGSGGRGDGALAARVPGAGKDLGRPTWSFVGRGLVVGSEREDLARIIRFGIPGTSMPGHEWLRDEEVAALAEQVLDRHAAGRSAVAGPAEGADS